MSFQFSRRQFVTGIAAGTVVTGLGSSSLLRASTGSIAPGYPPTLQGTQFNLEIGEKPVNFTGHARSATVVNGSLPAPILRFREGDTVTLRVRNTLKHASAIHWHGVLLPAAMDGVPGLSFHGIESGGSYLYQFEVKQQGTYWYHAHAHFQEQTGLYGPLLIDPRESEPFAYERDYVVMLSDWSDMAPERIFSVLKKQSDYFNLNQRTLADFTRDVGEQGLKAALADRRMWGEMRMKPTDISDVTGHTYTYLMNGNAPDTNWTGLFKRGDRIRLRFINGSAMSYFDVRIPGLKMTVVAADGQYVHPVTVDEFRIATAETLDVIVTPQADEAYTIFAQSMDRSGFARGTLAPRVGMQAAVPPLDRRPLLTMADMGMAGMSGGDHGSTAVMDHASMPDMDHSSMATSSSMVEHPATERDNPGVDMQTMSPSPRLDDPGIGLRDAQLQKLRAGYTAEHEVLALSDLRSLFSDPDGRDPGRTVELHLTGHMERYIFSFDGVKFSDAKPLEFKYGERLRIVLVNDTMMEHPIHLHGMWSDVEDEEGKFQVRKHTVTIPAGTKRSYRVTADALGRWAYHCHLLYHMEAGMFREVRVS
ncbi:MAG: copper resistance system multicopper oxidase [Pseudomonadota bacterium]